MSCSVKICGLRDKKALHAAVEGGATYLGFNFIPTSKRYITSTKARDLLTTLPQPTLCRFSQASPDIEDSEVLVLTALFADPKDKDILKVCETLSPFLGLIQLHGKEDPDRVAEIRQMTGLPVMKAIPIATSDDCAAAKVYEKVADMLLFDSKPPKGPSGGTGSSFDWSLLKGCRFKKPWMLAGGLNAKNVREAVKATRAKIVDTSSGVESRDKKDPAMIKAFLQACHEA